MIKPEFSFVAVLLLLPLPFAATLVAANAYNALKLPPWLRS